MREKEQLPSYYSSWKHDDRPRRHSSRGDLYASGNGSCSSYGATILQLSNFLFSTPASVGWYEVPASVHQPYTPSSQANKVLNGNSGLVFWACDIHEWTQKSWKFEHCWVNTVRVQRKGFGVLLKEKKIHPFNLHTVIYHLSVAFSALQELFCTVISFNLLSVCLVYFCLSWWVPTFPKMTLDNPQRTSVKPSHPMTMVRAK